MRLMAFAAFLALAGTLAAPARAATAVDAPTRTVTVGTDTVAYRTLGSGPPLLLLNRFRGTLDTWDPAFLDALARHRTLYLFDLPGIGYSEGVQPDSMEAGIALVDGFADALGLREFDLLGWSWGGLLAQAYAVDRPGRVGKLVLLATNPPGHNEIPLQPAFLERALKPVNDLADEEVLFFELASAASRQAAKHRANASISATAWTPASRPSRRSSNAISRRPADSTPIRPAAARGWGNWSCRSW